VIVYPYNLDSAVDWWKQNSGTFSRFKNLKVVFVHTNGIENLCDRTMRLQCNIVDGELTIHSEKGDTSIVCEVWK
jgi:uncharacterized protein YaeQ